MDTMNIQVHSTKTDIENQEILNCLAKESIEIITEELDYFYSNKEKMVELFIERIRTDEIKAGILNDFFEKCYSPEEVNTLIERIERQVKRQAGITQFANNFSFMNATDSLLIEPEAVDGVREEIRTLKLNQVIVKLVDLAWKNTCKTILPLGFCKYTSKYKPGEAILASIGLSPREIRDGIKVKLTKRLKGALKQHKTELSNLLTQKIISQIFFQQHSGSINIELIKTA
ncbi:hypothetical protein [Desulfosporosinus youngiae]|uniref:Uncharacterized protein n=1 Tax=Desulfosporosinus youngiae DSM 17734 TaxID=768710 RepID=H5XV63_9FIRM|nr:hypothetical protein [Desulfosporosinus youngiae]EHQ89661.1 hypothetical protein DesyoDRAFT_2595 [Desulfosporosinus youngiae DSM 17734]